MSRLGICTPRPRRNHLREELNRRTKSMLTEIEECQREVKQERKNAQHNHSMYVQEYEITRRLRLTIADLRRETVRLQAELALSVRMDEVPPNHLRKVS